MAGIYGRKDTGAFSVVLSGGYEDDEDKGYTLYVLSFNICMWPDIGSFYIAHILVAEDGIQVETRNYEQDHRHMTNLSRATREIWL